MKYMLVVRSEAADFDARDSGAPELQETFDFMENLIKDLIESGEFVDAAGLAAPRLAKTVRRQAGKTVTLDGPYAEAKEVLGGYFIVDCASEERALEIAARVVDFDGGPDALEVRALEG